MIQVLEWLSMGMSIFGTFLISKRHRAGWMVALASEPVWAGASWITHQWAFLAAAGVYAAINIRGWVHHGYQRPRAKTG
jgi:hypothetical protein